MINKFYRKISNKGDTSDYELVGSIGVNGIPLNIMKGADTTTDGEIGLVPKPTKGNSNRFLRSDGTWAVPPNTTYSVASTSANGLMSAGDKTKLDGIATGANRYTHPSYTAKSSGLYKVTVDSTGHVKATSAVTKSDITALGIPGQDTNTTYGNATTSTAGLMSAADKKKLDGISATATQLNYVKGVTSNIQTQLNRKAASNHTHSGLLVFTSTEVVNTTQALTWNIYTGLGYRPKCVIITPQINIGDAYLYYDFDRSNSSVVRISIYGNVVKGNIRFSIAIPAGSA